MPEIESIQSAASAMPFKRRRRRRLVVLGIMGRLPLAGVIWQMLHYLEGFRRLGFDVYYVEDTETWPYNPQKNTVSDDCSYAVGVIKSVLTTHGFADRWAYRSVTYSEQCFGLSAEDLRRLFKQTDVLVNLTASTILREEHLGVPLRVYLETDPVLPQIEVAKGNPLYLERLGAHTHHFSYGENLGAADCAVPIARFHYRPTRQPVVLDWWRSAAQARGNGTPASFTTVANWRQSSKDLEWNGVRYTWSKHHEFLKFIDLPKRTAQPFELALALQSGSAADRSWTGLSDEDGAAVRLLASHNWRVINALPVSMNIFSYRDYIRASRGEFTVAKDQNVRLRSGWSSDRSACYLAAGRPVITQDTGFGKFLPTGTGLFSFRTMDDILAAVETINADYPKQSRAARAVAEEFFKAETVLAKLIEDLGL
jgi:hypothetical protein